MTTQIDGFFSVLLDDPSVLEPGSSDNSRTFRGKLADKILRGSPRPDFAECPINPTYYDKTELRYPVLELQQWELIFTVGDKPYRMATPTAIEKLRRKGKLTEEEKEEGRNGLKIVWERNSVRPAD